jgi:co-chaperonin GroES (HSP10)
MEQTTPIKFFPCNDQILIKVDVKQPSVIERNVKDKPTMLPSGVVIAVGRGTFVPGTGFVEPQVQPGDHVCFMLEGRLERLPIAPEKDKDGNHQLFCSISESLIMGKLDFGTEDYEQKFDTIWFQTPGEGSPIIA